jgi:diaminopimelate decarboxylase
MYNSERMTVESLLSHVRKYHPTATVRVDGNILTVQAVTTATFPAGSAFGVSHEPREETILKYDLEEGREIKGRLAHVGLRFSDLLLWQEGISPW